MKQRAGILIYPDVEVLDFCGPFEVLSNAVERGSGEGCFDVSLVAETLDPVTTIGGMRVLPHFTLGDCPALDLLIVPGGNGRRRASERLVDWVAERGPEAGRLASVCTGAFSLAAARGLRARG